MTMSKKQVKKAEALTLRLLRERSVGLPGRPTDAKIAAAVRTLATVQLLDNLRCACEADAYEQVQTGVVDRTPFLLGDLTTIDNDDTEWLDNLMTESMQAMTDVAMEKQK